MYRYKNNQYGVIKLAILKDLEGKMVHRFM